MTRNVLSTHSYHPEVTLVSKSKVDDGYLIIPDTGRALSLFILMRIWRVIAIGFYFFFSLNHIHSAIVNIFFVIRMLVFVLSEMI